MLLAAPGAGETQSVRADECVPIGADWSGHCCCEPVDYVRAGQPGENIPRLPLIRDDFPVRASDRRLNDDLRNHLNG